MVRSVHDGRFPWIGKLATWILEYVDDEEITLLPADSEAEVRANTWSYDVVTDERSTRAELVAALIAVADGLRERWRDSPVPARFYAWYDAQAGNLVCSVTSQLVLPFSGDVVVVESPEMVVDELLADPAPGVVDLEAADADEASAPVQVWVSAV